MRRQKPKEERRRREDGGGEEEKSSTAAAGGYRPCNARERERRARRRTYWLVHQWGARGEGAGSYPPAVAVNEPGRVVWAPILTPAVAALVALRVCDDRTTSLPTLVAGGRQRQSRRYSRIAAAAPPSITARHAAKIAARSIAGIFASLAVHLVILRLIRWRSR